jgi:hypothetical protein
VTTALPVAPCSNPPWGWYENVKAVKRSTSFQILQTESFLGAGSSKHIYLNVKKIVAFFKMLF